MRFLTTLALLVPVISFGQSVVVTPTRPNGFNWGDGSAAIGYESTGMVLFGGGGRPMSLGSSCVWLLTGSGAPQNSYAGVGTGQFSNQYVRDLIWLNYKTYRGVTSVLTTTADRAYLPYLVLDVDTNNDGVKDVGFTYEPRFNGTPATSLWQTWKGATGVWWMHGNGETERRTLTSWLTKLGITHSAKMLWLTITVGGGINYTAWNNKVYGADALSVEFSGGSRTTFNFEAK